MTVYFVQDGGPEGHVKIGYTAGNPYGRIAAFRTGNPRPLALLVAIPGEPADEKAYHERFKDLRESGEWFRPEPRLLGFIEGLRVVHPEQPKDPGPSDFEGVFGLSRENLLAVLAIARLDAHRGEAERFRRRYAADLEEGYVAITPEEVDAIYLCLSRLGDDLSRTVDPSVADWDRFSHAAYASKIGVAIIKYVIPDLRDGLWALLAAHRACLAEYQANLQASPAVALEPS